MILSGAEKEATEENSNHWISIAEKFLFLLFSMNREEGIHIGRHKKELSAGARLSRAESGTVRFRRKNRAHSNSDIDLAVIMDVSHPSFMEERVDVHLASMTINPRIETVTLHPEDFLRPFFTLAREIEREQE